MQCPKPPPPPPKKIRWQVLCGCNPSALLRVPFTEAAPRAPRSHRGAAGAAERTKRRRAASSESRKCNLIHHWQHRPRSKHPGPRPTAFAQSPMHHMTQKERGLPVQLPGLQLDSLPGNSVFAPFCRTHGGRSSTAAAPRHISVKATAGTTSKH